LRIWDPKRRFIEILRGRVDRVEEELADYLKEKERGYPRLYGANDNIDDIDLEKMSPPELYDLANAGNILAHNKLLEIYADKFNWTVAYILPYYKAEVMRVHNISSEEYDRRTMLADQSIYLPQPNRKFKPTLYSERIAHILGLDYQRLQDKFKRGELENWIAGSRRGFWRDEDPGAVF
jgi:hypothetical protein